MVSRIYWLLFLIYLFANDVLSHVAAGRIDSRHRAKRSSSRVSERKCEEYSQGTTCKNSYVNIDKTAVEDTQPKEFPHLVFIAANETQDNNLEFVCMGSLISPRFVMTVAHCTTNPSHSLSHVFLSDYSTKPTTEGRVSTVEISIKAIHNHPEYQRPVKYNDIALLELVSDVPLNANVRPACLWMDNQFAGHDKALLATINRTEGLELRDVILKVPVTLKKNHKCNYSAWMSNRWPNGMDETQLCGKGASNKEMAVGGAPLQIILNEQTGCAFRIIGLASFGNLACMGFRTVFTRTSSYVDWIESVVWPAE